MAERVWQNGKKKLSGCNSGNFTKQEVWKGTHNNIILKKMSVIIFNETKYFIALRHPGCWSYYKQSTLSYQIPHRDDQLGTQARKFLNKLFSPSADIRQLCWHSNMIYFWCRTVAIWQCSVQLLISKIHTFFNFGNKIFTVSQY